MNWRVSGAVVLMLVVGAAAGYAVGTQDEPAAASRSTFADAAPVPATNPRLPVEIFRQDPDDEALETAVRLRPATLVAQDADGRPTRYRLDVQVPDGWTENRIAPAEWRYTVPGNDPMSFGLRVEIIADRQQSIASAVQSRESELKSARLQESFSDLDIRPDGDEGFVAEYVLDGYQRFSIERFYSGPDGLAYATVAAYGRARDVTGLSDLLERVSIRLQPVVQRP